MAIEPFNPQTADTQVLDLMKSIRTAEGTGSVQKSGKTGEMKSLYQWEPGTWKAAAKQYLGAENADMTPGNENYVAYHRIADWKKAKKTPGQIASLWNSGQEDPNKVRGGGVGASSSNPDVQYNVPAYVNKVYDTYTQLQKARAATPSPQAAAPAPATSTTTPQGLTGADSNKSFLGKLMPSPKDFQSRMQSAAQGSSDLRSYAAKDILSAGEKPKGFAEDVIQSTIGSRGLAGVAQMPGKVASIPAQTNTSEMLSKDVGNIADQATKYLKQAHTETDPSKKSRLIAAAKSLFQTSQDLSSVRNETDANTISPGQAAGTAVQAGLTAGTFGAAGVGEAVAKPILTRAIEGGALGYGYDVASKLQQDKSAKDVITPGVGTLAGVLTPFATGLVGNLMKKTAGALTGAGENVIQNAVDHPAEVDAAIKKFASDPEAKQALVDTATEGLTSFQQQKTKEYGEKLAELQFKKPMEENFALKSLEGSVGKFGGSIDESGNLVFKNSTLTDTDQRNVQSVFNKVLGWDDFSVKGQDNLRQAIDGYIKEFKLAGGNPRSNVILGQVKKELTTAIADSVPGYKDVLTTYGTKSEAAKDFVREFQLGGSAKNSTKLNNIMKLMKKDPAVMKNFEEIFGKKAAEDFRNEVSGAILSNWLPVSGKLQSGLEAGALYEGVKAGGLPALFGAAGTLGASSPRIAGRVATMAGDVLNQTGNLGRLVVPKAASELSNSEKLKQSSNK